MGPNLIFSLFILLLSVIYFFYERFIEKEIDLSNDSIQRTAAYQGLRILAIWGIVSLHSGFSIFGGGNVLCSFFFILSGFLYKGPRDNESFGRYIFRKCKTVYPIYWFCLSVYFLITYFFCNFEFKLDWNIIPHFLLIQSWSHYFNAYGYLGPAWFLSSLLPCYCLSFWMIKYIRKNIWLSIITIVLVYTFTQLQSDLWWNYISPLYRLTEYASGLCLRDAIAERKIQKEIFPYVSLFILVVWLFFLRYINFLPLVELSHLFVIGYFYLFYSRGSQGLLANGFVFATSPYIIFIFLVHLTLFPFIFKVLNSYNPLLVSIEAFILSILIGIVYFRVANCLNSRRNG